MENEVTTGEAQETAPENAQVEEVTNTEPVEDPPAKEDSVEVAKLKAEIAKLNSKADTLARENADQKRQLRSYKTAEEIREEERREAEEAKDARLAELEREIAIGKIAKSILTMTSDESQASKMAEWLHGAEDAYAAIAEFKKIQDAAIKKLKIEYGKIPAPGIGGAEAPAVTKEEFKGMGYMQRLDLKRKFPELYAQLAN